MDDALKAVGLIFLAVIFGLISGFTKAYLAERWEDDPTYVCYSQSEGSYMIVDGLRIDCQEPPRATTTTPSTEGAGSG